MIENVPNGTIKHEKSSIQSKPQYGRNCELINRADHLTNILHQQNQIDDESDTKQDILVEITNGFIHPEVKVETQPNPIVSTIPELGVDDELLLNKMPFANDRNLPVRKTRSCSDLKKVGNLKFESAPNNICLAKRMHELDLQYQKCKREPEIMIKKRYTWPYVLNPSEVKSKIKSFLPPNLRKSLSIFLADDAFAGPLDDIDIDSETKCSAFMNSNWCLCLVVPTIMVICLVVIAYLTSSYMQTLMLWIETQNSYLVLSVLSLMYIVMCFPISFGFFLLKIVTGYLYGFLFGIAVAICNSMLGVAITHFSLRGLSNICDCKKLIKNRTAMAIIRVIDGPRAFRIVVFTRFTPLPTGVQNLIFSLCNIKWYIYLLATLIGMMPSEILTVYLGSGFRSMQDVLSTKGLIWPTYVLVAIGVLFGFILMTWVVLKAKNELRSMIEEERQNSTTV